MNPRTFTVVAALFAALVPLSGVRGDSPAPVNAAAPPSVTTRETADTLVADNGLVALALSKRSGEIVSVRLRHNSTNTEMGKPGDAVYFDVNAGAKAVPTGQTPPKAGYQRLGGLVDRYFVAPGSGPESADLVAEGGPKVFFPFHTEVHYVLRRGVSGFYAYAILRHGAGMGAGGIGQARWVMRGTTGDDALYTHHVVDDARKGPVPTSPGVRQVMDATTLLKDGTVYTKYDNTAFEADDLVHGMAGVRNGVGLGAWVINGSREFVNGGPLKQELTVHQGNTLLNMIEGGHFGASSIEVGDNQVWSKTFGPTLFYLNSGPTIDALWADAKHQGATEEAAWPYRWADGPDYPTRRGSVSGKLLVNGAPASGAWVIVSEPGMDPSRQANGYAFWTRASADGGFVVKNVRPGDYTLYAFGGGSFEPFQREKITVQPETTTPTGVMAWTPATHGKTLWQVGTADRSPNEFKNGDDYRHWANYRRYPKDFPNDVTFTVGKSNPKRDWNYAQWSWYNRQPYWAIDFPLSAAQTNGTTATLTFGFAAVNPAGGKRDAELTITVNGTAVKTLALPKSGAAVYRSGAQDSAYRVEYVSFPAALLHAGRNEIRLGQAGAEPFPNDDATVMRGVVGAIIYDAIRLEIE